MNATRPVNHPEWTDAQVSTELRVDGYDVSMAYRDALVEAMFNHRADRHRE